MRHLYFFDIYEEYSSGFTTFKEEFFSCLGNTHSICLHRLILKYPINELKIAIENGIECFYIPPIEPHCFYQTILGTLLCRYINDSCNVVFLLNAAPTYILISMLKEYFPHSRKIYVLHDFIWAHFLVGDIEGFKKIVSREKKHKYSDIILKAYEDNVKTFMSVDKIVCLSDDSYMLLNDFFQVPSSKLVVIYDAIRDFGIKRSLKTSRNEKGVVVFITAGRVTRQKGMIDLLCSFKKVLKVYPQCLLVIAGYKGKEISTELCDSMEGKILFLGNIGREELYQWYQKADIGIIPSYYEQCGYVGIEMQMFGLPIIASDAFGVRSMFNSTNAIIVNIGNRENNEYRENLKNSLIEVLGLSRKELEVYSDKARETYENKYHINNMRKRYLDLITNI